MLTPHLGLLASIWAACSAKVPSVSALNFSCAAFNAANFDFKSLRSVSVAALNGLKTVLMKVNKLSFKASNWSFNNLSPSVRSLISLASLPLKSVTALFKSFSSLFLSSLNLFSKSSLFWSTLIVSCFNFSIKSTYRNQDGYLYLHELIIESLRLIY